MFGPQNGKNISSPVLNKRLVSKIYKDKQEKNNLPNFKMIIGLK
jgi:hypothetical protein